MTLTFGFAEKVSIIAVASIAAAAGLTWLKRSRVVKIPQTWTEIGVVSSLCIYPLKSGKGMLCDRVECTETGASFSTAHDRMLLIIDSNGNVQSGREYPRLTQIAAEVEDNRLTLSGPDCETKAQVTLPPEGELVQLSIWNAPTEGIDCGNEIADWLTSYLKADSPLRLLFHIREKDFNPGIKKLLRMTKRDARKTDAGLFSDGFSYHLISEASVDDLNRRCQTQVTPYHFRPNIVVQGLKLVPYEEDRWEWVKIGDVIFRFLAPCMRCQFTTVDPETGKKSTELEPLKTLRGYRFVRDPEIRKFVYTPTMGIYIGARGKGVISVGDVVSVSEGK